MSDQENVLKAATAVAEALDEPRCACPKCGTPLELQQIIPEKSTLTLSLEASGAMIEARTIGGMVSNMASMLEECGKALDAPVTVFVNGMRCDGPSASVDLVILRSATP